MSSEGKATDQDEDLGKRLLKGLVNELIRRLEDPAVAKDMSASEGELIRKLCADNSVSLASIKAGDFGEVARRAAEEYPFPEGGQVDMSTTSH